MSNRRKKLKKPSKDATEPVDVVHGSAALIEYRAIKSIVYSADEIAAWTKFVADFVFGTPRHVCDREEYSKFRIVPQNKIQNRSANSESWIFSGSHISVRCP